MHRAEHFSNGVHADIQQAEGKNEMKEDSWASTLLEPSRIRNNSSIFVKSTHLTPSLYQLTTNSLNHTGPRSFHAMASRFAEQKSTMQPVRPELGASSLFGDVTSHVNEVPVEQGGKATIKEVNSLSLEKDTTTGIRRIGSGAHRRQQIVYQQERTKRDME